MMTQPRSDTISSLLVDTVSGTLYTGSLNSDIHVIYVGRGNILRTLSGSNTTNSSEQFGRHTTRARVVIDGKLCGQRFRWRP